MDEMRNSVVILTQALIGVARIICTEYRRSGTGVPESSIYTAIGTDLNKYNHFASLLEDAGFARKNYMWYPSDKMIEVLGTFKGKI
jgi:hypothetical protein